MIQNDHALRMCLCMLASPMYVGGGVNKKLGRIKTRNSYAHRCYTPVLEEEEGGNDHRCPVIGVMAAV
jgi:hypothetical protein